jgi:hypothetical protein
VEKDTDETNMLKWIYYSVWCVSGLQPARIRGAEKPCSGLMRDHHLRTVNSGFMLSGGGARSVDRSGMNHADFI